MTYHLTDEQLTALREQFSANAIQAIEKGQLEASAAWTQAMTAIHDAQMEAQKLRDQKARARRLAALT